MTTNQSLLPPYPPGPGAASSSPPSSSSPPQRNGDYSTRPRTPSSSIRGATHSSPSASSVSPASSSTTRSSTYAYQARTRQSQEELRAQARAHIHVQRSPSTSASASNSDKASPVTKAAKAKPVDPNITSTILSSDHTARTLRQGYEKVIGGEHERAGLRERNSGEGKVQGPMRSSHVPEPLKQARSMSRRKRPPTPPAESTAASLTRSNIPPPLPPPRSVSNSSSSSTPTTHVPPPVKAPSISPPANKSSFGLVSAQSISLPGSSKSAQSSLADLPEGTSSRTQRNMNVGGSGSNFTSASSSPGRSGFMAPPPPAPGLSSGNFLASNTSRLVQATASPTPFPQTSSGTTASSTSSSSPRRKPSLSSPSPPTPLVPRPLVPKAGIPRTTPAPLNLAGASTHQSYTSSQTLDTQKLSSSPSHTANAASSHVLLTRTTNQIPPTPPNHQHAQYVHIHQPRQAAHSSPQSLPDSPSARAIMKRLLAKPAPPSGTPTGSHFGTSGSESEGRGLYTGSAIHAQRKRKDLNAVLGHPVTGSGSRLRAAERGWRSEPEDSTPSREKRKREKERLAKEAGIEFDMKGVDLLDREIAKLGESVGIVGEGNVDLKSPSLDHLPVEKEKKKLRNVLRRRPSANVVASAKVGTPPRSPHPVSRSTSASASVAASRLSHSNNASLSTSNSHTNFTSQLPTLPFPTSPLSPLSMPLSVLGGESNERSGLHRPFSASGTTVNLDNPASTSLLRPPLHKAQSTPGSASTSRSPSRSRASSPARSPIVSTLLSSWSGPTSATASPSTPKGAGLGILASGKRRNRAQGKVDNEEQEQEEKKARERTERAKASLTPAESLIEAYKAREKLRVAQEERLEFEKEQERLRASAARAKATEMDVERERLEQRIEPRVLQSEVVEKHAIPLPPVRSRSQPSSSSQSPRNSLSGNGSYSSSIKPKFLKRRPSSPVLFADPATYTLHTQRLTTNKGILVGANETETTAPRTIEPDEDAPSTTGTPSKTILGANSARIVAVGTVEDSWDTYGRVHLGWDPKLLNKRTSIEKPSPAKDGLGRTLSKKVSARWKKQELGDVHELERSGRPAVRARASLQDRRKGETSLGRGREDDQEQLEKIRNRRSLRLSIDKFVEDIEPDLPTLTRTESGGKLSKARTSKSEPSSPGGHGPSRLWKLMRRISVAGGLKEKYHDDGAPPPVPALPGHILTATRSNDSKKNSPTIAATPPSVSASAPSHASHAVQPPQPRPSTTTRSSSPMSSAENSSSKFFHRTHSTHSSTSSVTDMIPPPLPKPSLHLMGKHIVQPNLLDEVSSQDNVPLSPRQIPSGVIDMPLRKTPTEDEWTIIRSPSVELPSLTLPPRRPHVGITGVMKVGTPPQSSSMQPLLANVPPQSNSSQTKLDIDRSESPTIPSFSTDAAVNAFPARRFSTTLSSRSRTSNNSPHPSSSPTPCAATPVGVGVGELTMTIARTRSSSPITSVPLTALSPPPPRPQRSTARPPPARLTVEPLTQPSYFEIAGKWSEPSSISSVTPQDININSKPSRRSSSGFGSTSSIASRPAYRRRSSSVSQPAGLQGLGLTAAPALATFGRSTSPPSPSQMSLSLSLISTAGSDLTVLDNSRSHEFTFRELDPSLPKPLLSEQEKADRWDELLKRSDKAGGTLHLEGGRGLGLRNRG